MGINLGDLRGTQGLMKSLRLTLNDQIVVSVEDLAGGVSAPGESSKMGEIEQANHDVARLYSAFGQKTSQWESQARGLEQQMKVQAAKNPKSISIEKMNRMKSEQIAVRTVHSHGGGAIPAIASGAGPGLHEFAAAAGRGGSSGFKRATRNFSRRFSGRGSRAAGRDS